MEARWLIWSAISKETFPPTWLIFHLNKTFIESCPTCEELKSNAKCSSFFVFLGGGGRGVFYQCEECACMLHRIRLRDVLVPIFNVLWGIDTNISQCEIYGLWNMRFNAAFNCVWKGEILKLTALLNTWNGENNFHGMQQSQTRDMSALKQNDDVFSQKLACAK